MQHIRQKRTMIFLFNNLTPIQNFLYSLFCVLVAATFSYYLTERPCIRFGQKL
jgi:peptidoglycan/LPS O-acetylase OafA/YrhL